MSAARKAQFKLPPLQRQGSQESRRIKALEDQKRRRTQRIDSARNLDLFAGLTLGPSDDEDDEHDGPVRTGVSSYAAMLNADPADSSRPASSSSSAIQADGEVYQDDTNTNAHAQPSGSNFTKKKTRRKRRGGKGQSNVQGSKYADKCMYAELLEMRADVPWDNNGHAVDDGLPDDLESGWVAVAPVPAGKRCLVVSYQSSGVAGNVPNTQLRSRLLGKSLVRPFPSPLPPQTILDCILDENWRDNGLIHVLDVVKWKTQDVGDCETAFRFWFRDARLSELPPPTPPLTIRPPPSASASASASTSVPAPAPNAITPDPTKYRFPYPCTFLPVPYTSDTTLPFLLSQVIPAARSIREIDLVIPQLVPAPSPFGLPSVPFTPNISTEVSMQVDTASILPTPLPTPAPQPAQVYTPAPGRATVRPDGFLLYVREAGYEPGTSPLSTWVPVELDVPSDGTNAAAQTRPLELFEWLVRRRMNAQANQGALHHEMMDS